MGDLRRYAMGDLYKCPEKLVAAVGCEKTKADGGCPFKRCNKVKTNHTKICVLDNKESPSCTEAACQAHCANSTKLDGTCTHWSYDVVEGECYVFAGCNDIKFDADYVQYAMKDYTCEKTLEAFPKGCEKRRCNKSKSTNAKVCTDTDSTTTCSVSECKAKCSTHSDFACTSYAHSTTGECYVFKDCIDEAGAEKSCTINCVDDCTIDVCCPRKSKRHLG